MLFSLFLWTLGLGCVDTSDIYVVLSIIVCFEYREDACIPSFCCVCVHYLRILKDFSTELTLLSYPRTSKGTNKESNKLLLV